jgi:hypothetical protein
MPTHPLFCDRSEQLVRAGPLAISSGAIIPYAIPLKSYRATSSENTFIGIAAEGISKKTPEMNM